METKVTEVADEIFRISTFLPDYGLQLNQFLIRDEEPFLMHTGMKGVFEATLSGIATLIDPSRLRWIGFSHFESDECGALNEFLRIAPQAQAVTGLVGAMVNVNDFAIREARALENEEILKIGRRRIRYLATPHVPHAWDAGLFWEETDQTLFCSDLFFQSGNPDALVESDIVEAARSAIVETMDTPFGKDMPYCTDTESILNRLSQLKPRTLATMHGSSFRGDGSKAVMELTGVIKELLGKPMENSTP